VSKGEPDSVESILAEAEEIEKPCSGTRFRTLKRIASNPDNHVVLAFGGGSVPGIAGNCALAAMLAELGVLEHVKEIWGTSAGSIIGGLLAAGLTPDEIMEAVVDLGRRKPIEVAWGQLLWGVLKRDLPDGLIKGRKFRDALEAALPVRNVEDCPIPYRAIAVTDDGYASPRVFRDGPLVDALMASMCIPGIAWPVQRDGVGYFDGSIVEKTPLLSVIADHKRSGRKSNLFLIASHYDDRGRIEKPRGFLQRLVSTITAMEEIIWRYQVDDARASGAKFVILNPQMEHGGMYDFDAVRLNYLWCRKRYKQQLSNAGFAARFEAL
jgi:NTE family protein